MTHTALGPGAEFDRVRAIAAALGGRAGSLGDDCATLELRGGKLVLSTDVSVEGVHFDRRWLTLEEIGWRAAAAALSDLAACGAECLGLLAAVTVPDDSSEAELVSLMRGVGSATAAAGGAVLGGDLSKGPAWSVAATVVGRAERPLSRSGARPGDGLWVTGALGGAAAALAAWQRGEVPDPAARRAFAHPEPRLRAGRWLAAHAAHAMIDLSDGLAGDARHLAAASAVALDIDLAELSMAPGVLAVAGDEPPAGFAARGGEDYELLVALAPEFADADRARFTAECGITLTRIGSVELGKSVRLRLGTGEILTEGYDHFT